MLQTAYNLGDGTSIRVTFRDPDTRALVDPDSVVIRVKPPNTSQTTSYQYGVGGSTLIRNGVGAYQLNVADTVVGQWTARIVASGATYYGSKTIYWNVADPGI